MCCGVQEGDKLLWVGQCQEDSSVLLASSAGKALHLPTTDSELRPQGRQARGLRVHPPSSSPTAPSLKPHSQLVTLALRLLVMLQLTAMSVPLMVLDAC